MSRSIFLYSLLAILAGLPAYLSAQPYRYTAPFYRHSQYWEAIDTQSFKTGDLVACIASNKELKSILTKVGTRSRYTHVGIIWKDSTDGSLWVTHSTPNEYQALSYGETTPRSGVLMTRLTDIIHSGHYKLLEVYALLESFQLTSQQIWWSYQQHKGIPFEKNLFQFAAAGLDLTICHQDLILNSIDDRAFFCSEYIAYVLADHNLIDLTDKRAAEYAPSEIRRLPIYANAPMARIRHSLIVPILPTLPAPAIVMSHTISLKP